MFYFAFGKRINDRIFRSTKTESEKLTSMKKTISILLILSFFLSTLGLIADGDPKEASMLLRFVEFFSMAAVIFVIFSTIYFGAYYIFKKLGSSKI